MLRFMVKKLNHRNEGVTLVEIIVSLLILAIIFVPMLTSYVTANKANAMAKEKMYATVLGENVMEAVKLLGIEGTAKQCSELNIGTFVLANGEAAGENMLMHSEVAQEGIAPSVSEKDGTLVFSDARGTESYRYSITNAKEGTGLYDVTITFSSLNYTNSIVTPGAGSPTSVPLNNYAFADMSAFNAMSTAMIKPPTKDLQPSGTPTPAPAVTSTPVYVPQEIQFDSMALDYYAQLNENYMNELYIQDVDKVSNDYSVEYQKYVEEYRKWEEKKEGQEPTPPPVPSMPDKSESKYQVTSKDELKNRMSRKFAVTICQDDKGKLYLESSMVYQIDNTGKICGEDASGKFKRTYTGYCSNAVYDKLQSIFIIYTPLNSNYKFAGESITIDNKVPLVFSGDRPVHSFDVYVAVQAPPEKKLDTLTNKLATQVNGATPYKVNGVDYSTVTLYSSAPLDTTNMIKDNLMKDVTKSSERIYEVSVEVRRAGEAEVMETIQSTVMR